MSIELAPYCYECHRRIVGCLGKYGCWKHLHDNKELGEDGHIARPRCAA